MFADGEYYLRELNPYILNSDSHSFDNAATDESCAEYCSLSHGDLKKVYSIIYNASDCYCLDTRNSTVTAGKICHHLFLIANFLAKFSDFEKKLVKVWNEVGRL